MYILQQTTKPLMKRETVIPKAARLLWSAPTTKGRDSWRLSGSVSNDICMGQGWGLARDTCMHACTMNVYTTAVLQNTPPCQKNPRSLKTKKGELIRIYDHKHNCNTLFSHLNNTCQKIKKPNCMGKLLKFYAFTIIRVYEQSSNTKSSNDQVNMYKQNYM